MAQKIYVLVKKFKGVNDDVELFGNEDEVLGAVKNYTGARYSKNYTDSESEEYLSDYSKTKIFELDLPGFLDFKSKRG